MLTRYWEKCVNDFRLALQPFEIYHVECYTSKNIDKMLEFVRALKDIGDRVIVDFGDCCFDKMQDASCREGLLRIVWHYTPLTSLIFKPEIMVARARDKKS